jgi:hypothetical protein
MGESGEAMATRWQSVRGRRGLRSNRLRRRESSDDWTSRVRYFNTAVHRKHCRRVAGMRLCCGKHRLGLEPELRRADQQASMSMSFVPLCDHHSSKLTYSSAPSLYNNKNLRRFDWNVRHQQALFTENSSFHPNRAIMDISQAVSGYITKMVSTGDAVQSQAAAKMKILLLDNETVCSLIIIISHRKLTPL